MILLLHICIAITSLGFTTYMFLRPSDAKLRASYVLVAATIASGTVLVVENAAHILQACMSGLLYTAISFVTIGATRTKLAAVRSTNREK